MIATSSNMVARWAMGLLGAGLMATAQAAPVNLLMEDGLTVGEAYETLWGPVRNKDFAGDLTVETGGGQKGGACLKITAFDAPGDAAHRYGEWRFKPQITLDSGEEYRFSAWAKGHVDAPAGAGVYVNVYGFDSADKPRPLLIRQVAVASDDWKELTGTFRVPQDIVRVRVGIGIDQGVGEVCFDQVWLAPSMETPESR